VRLHLEIRRDVGAAHPECKSKHDVLQIVVGKVLCRRVLKEGHALYFPPGIEHSLASRLGLQAGFLQGVVRVRHGGFDLMVQLNKKDSKTKAS